MRRLPLLFALVALAGCATVFEAPPQESRLAEVDETLSWWRLPDRSGRFEPEIAPLPVRVPVRIIERRALPLPPQDLLERLRRGFAMPDLNTARVRKRQEWYAQHPQLTQRMFERSALYLYHILEEVEKRGLPTEIALIPFIESGFDPQATSDAQAAGIWQFVPFTATRYNLKLGAVKDERRDIVASTHAALDYLEFLYQTFGDWQLALASYNWGENAVGRVVERNRALGRSVRFEHLPLPEETQDYIPKLQAIKNIILNPGAMGFVLPPLPNRPYFAAFMLDTSLKVADAARLAGMTLGEFLALNPAFTNHVIPRRNRIILPVDQLAFFGARFDEYQLRLVR